MKTTVRHLRVLWSRGGEAGATMIEYGLLIALIGVVAASGASMLGQSLSAGFDRAIAAISGFEDAPEDVEPQEPAAAAADAAAGGAPVAGGGAGAGAGGGAPAKPKGNSAAAPGHGDGQGGGRNR